VRLRSPTHPRHGSSAPSIAMSRCRGREEGASAGGGARPIARGVRIPSGLHVPLTRRPAEALKGFRAGDEHIARRIPESAARDATPSNQWLVPLPEISFRASLPAKCLHKRRRPRSFNPAHPAHPCPPRFVTRDASPRGFDPAHPCAPTHLATVAPARSRAEPSPLPHTSTRQGGR